MPRTITVRETYPDGSVREATYVLGEEGKTDSGGVPPGAPFPVEHKEHGMSDGGYVNGNTALWVLAACAVILVLVFVIVPNLR
jgi:hypothetical protein